MKSDISGVVCALATRCAERTISVHYAQRRSGLANMGWRVNAHQSAPSSQRMSVTRCHPCSTPFFILSLLSFVGRYTQSAHHHHQGLDHDLVLGQIAGEPCVVCDKNRV